MKAVFTTALLALSTSAIAFPVCQFPSSDTNNDGWGWENNESCQVSETDTDTTGTPTCLFPGISDPDGDGWGWESGSSCRVDLVTPDPTDALFASALAGRWQCNTRTPSMIGNESRTHSPYDFGLDFSVLTNEQLNLITQTPLAGSYHYPRIAGWNVQPQIICGSKCAENYDGSRTYQFAENGSVTLEVVDGSGYWQGIQYLQWSTDNYQLTIGDESFQKLAFEQFQGNAFLHLYLTDSKRWTCAKQ